MGCGSGERGVIPEFIEPDPFDTWLIISGVPASNQPLENIPVADRPLLVELIREFNLRLEKAAMDAGHRFVDVYRMTVAEDGWSNRRWHIDAHHLGSAGWIEAVRRLVSRPGTLN